MIRVFLLLATLFAALSVAGGAFASHALKAQLTEKALAIFETGTRYQMYHALALLLLALFGLRTESLTLPLSIAGWAFIAGIILFSGSLYALSLSGVKWLGAITPIGGVAFLIGWGSFAIAAWNLK